MPARGAIPGTGRRAAWSPTSPTSSPSSLLLPAPPPATTNATGTTVHPSASYAGPNARPACIESVSWRNRDGSSENDDMPEFSTFDGLRLAYDDEGDGPPTVLLHGFAADAAINWVRPGITDALVAAGPPVI